MIKLLFRIEQILDSRIPRGKDSCRFSRPRWDISLGGWPTLEKINPWRDISFEDVRGCPMNSGPRSLFRIVSSLILFADFCSRILAFEDIRTTCFSLRLTRKRENFFGKRKKNAISLWDSRFAEARAKTSCEWIDRSSRALMLLVERRGSR